MVILKAIFSYSLYKNTPKAFNIPRKSGYMRLCYIALMTVFFPVNAMEGDAAAGFGVEKEVQLRQSSRASSRGGIGLREMGYLNALSEGQLKALSRKAVEKEKIIDIGLHLRLQAHGFQDDTIRHLPYNVIRKLKSLPEKKYLKALHDIANGHFQDDPLPALRHRSPDPRDVDRKMRCQRMHRQLLMALAARDLKAKSRERGGYVVVEVHGDVGQEETLKGEKKGKHRRRLSACSRVGNGLWTRIKMFLSPSAIELDT